MSDSTDRDREWPTSNRPEGVRLFARHLLLEGFAEDARVIRAWERWRSTPVMERQWFRLRLDARHPRQPDREARAYVEFVETLAAELGVRDDWFLEAIHQLLGTPEAADRPNAWVTGAFVDQEMTFSIRYEGQTLAEARDELDRQLEREWRERNLPERPSRRGELERNVRWLYWRLCGADSRAIAGKQLRKYNENVSEVAVRQGVVQAAELAGISLRAE